MKSTHSNRRFRTFPGRPLLFAVAIFAIAATGCSEPETTWSGPLFVKEREIHFDTDEIQLANIFNLAAGPSGNIVVSNGFASQAVLFDSEGNLIKNLDPAACHPGFELRPLNVAVGMDHIMMNNSAPWGYVFDAKGDCFSSVDQEYLPLDYSTILDGDNELLVGTREHTTSGPIIYMADIQGRTLSSTQLPEGAFTHIDYRFAGGGFAADAKGMFYAPSVSPELYKVSGSEVEAIPRDAFLDRSDPANDLPSHELPTREQSTQILQTATFNEGVYFLNNHLLFLQYNSRNSGSDWVVMNRDNPSMVATQETDIRFKFVRDGFGYAVVTPSIQEDGSMPNPHIEVYRYTGPDLTGN